ncbi:MAG: hypothetical protein ACRYHQ_04020 [Janthinobacterium lividum]
MSAHPEGKLPTVCRKLAKMKAKWEGLYDATSDFGPLTTFGDHAWNDDTNHV